MDIAPTYMPLMNIVATVRRVHLPEAGELKAYRRILSVDEIADYEDYKNVFKWNPAKDIHGSSLKKGKMFSVICEQRGYSEEELLEELERRRNVLSWMRERNIRSYKDVAAIITEYYSRPKEFYEGEVEVVAIPQHS